MASDTHRWTQCRWGDIATLEYGKALREYQEADGDVPVFGTNGQIGWHTKPLYSFPSVVVGRKGAYRGIHYADRPFFVIDTAFYLKPKEGSTFDSLWAYYCLRTYDINSMDSGSAIPSTSRDSFYQLPVVVPPLAEQRAIAEVLGALDDKIEANAQIAATLTAAVDALTEAHVGKAVVALGERAVQTKRTISAEKLASEDLALFSIPAFDDGGLPELVHGSTVKSGKAEVPQGSVLVSRLNPRFPRVWLPDLSDDRRNVCSTEFAVLSPADGVSSAMLWALLRRDAFSQELQARATGTTGSRQRVRPAAILEVNIPDPLGPGLGPLGSTIGSLTAQMAALRSQSAVLKELRDALLPRLVSGDLRVPDAERLVGEAA